MTTISATMITAAIATMDTVETARTTATSFPATSVRNLLVTRRPVVLPNRGPTRAADRRCDSYSHSR
jgi:hypothetical protein